MRISWLIKARYAVFDSVSCSCLSISSKVENFFFTMKLRMVTSIPNIHSFRDCFDMAYVPRKGRRLFWLVLGRRSRLRAFFRTLAPHKIDSFARKIWLPLDPNRWTREPCASLSVSSPPPRPSSPFPLGIKSEDGEAVRRDVRVPKV